MPPMMPPSKRQKLHESNTYSKLSDLNEGNDRVNFFAVLKCYFPSKKSRGTDYCIHFIVIDPSLSDDANSGLKVMWFRPEQKELPEFGAVGDIVRCHRVEIKGSPFGMQCISSKRTNSSIVCFSGCPDSPIEATWSSSPDPGITDRDREMVAELRLWASTSEAIELERSGTLSLALSSLPGGECSFCLLCQVIQVHELLNMNPPRAVIRVWDGTKPSRPITRMFESATGLRNSTGTFAPSDWMADVVVYDVNAKCAAALKAGDLIRLPKLHMRRAAGSADEDPGTCPVELSMRTFYCPTNGPNLREVTAADCPDLVERIQAVVHDRQQEMRSMQSSRTVAGNPWLGFSSIAQIKEAEAPAKFRLRCSVVRHLPRNAMDIAVLECRQCCCQFSCPPSDAPATGPSAASGASNHHVHVDSSASPVCGGGDESSSVNSADCTERMAAGGLAHLCGLWFNPDTNSYYCPHCSPKSEENVRLRFVFRFAMVLRDDSGELLVRCSGKDAEDFFQLQPCNLALSTAVRGAIDSCLKGLVSTVGEDGALSCAANDEPSLVECCLKSHHMLRGPVTEECSDSEALTSTVAYQLFDTSCEV